MRAIINIYKNNIEESEKLLKFSYLNNKYDENTLFNIAYIKELKQEYKEALNFYNEALKLSLDEELNKEILNKINEIKNIF
jgi:tetratricopeptide (TPR) repeat protein